MSYQTSIHFNPTALLIIKNEVVNSIQQVESAVNSLVEDQTLPFGIDDALIQLEQCTNVLTLIDMPFLAQVTQYSADLMRKIMATPEHPDTQAVTTLSESTTMLKRYIEFICLREVRVPQFLLESLNKLEIALGKPVTHEGHQLIPLLSCFTPDFDLPQVAALEKSVFVHKLYKICLNHLLQNKKSELDHAGFKLVGTYLAGSSKGQPSAQYWNLIHVALNHIDTLCLNQPRLRTLIQIEHNMAQYFAAPESFKAAMQDLSDVLCLCLSQDDAVAQNIREQMNLGEEQLTDTEIKLYSRQMFGPDFETIHTISELITTELTEIRSTVEQNYQTLTIAQISQIQQQLYSLANIFKVLNLANCSNDLKNYADALNNASILTDAAYAQQFMQVMSSGLNAISILERNFISSRLTLRVNNMNIEVDRLDDAHDTLIQESFQLISNMSQNITDYLQQQNRELLATLATQLTELSGALLFLGSSEGREIVLQVAGFVEQFLADETHQFTPQQATYLLNVLASADLFIENLKNKQPVLESVFQLGFASTQQLLKSAA